MNCSLQLTVSVCYQHYKEEVIDDNGVEMFAKLKEFSFFSVNVKILSKFSF